MPYFAISITLSCHIGCLFDTLDLSVCSFKKVARIIIFITYLVGLQLLLLLLPLLRVQLDEVVRFMDHIYINIVVFFFQTVYF